LKVEEYLLVEAAELFFYHEEGDNGLLHNVGRFPQTHGRDTRRHCSS